MQLPVYLDAMATTPMDPRVAECLSGCLLKSGIFGNPASQTHCYGYAAAECVQHARQQVADAINASAREIIWTSGATEADNLAIKGVAEFYQRNGKHIITMSTEHKAVLDTCDYLQSIGFSVTYLSPAANGLVDLEVLREAITAETILISVMLVNNEIGVIQDLAAISQIAHDKGVLVHSDAAQAAGKMNIDVAALGIDLMSFSGHKVYGPKGIGALYVRRKPRVRLTAQMHGGGHEWGMRSGTLATHQIVGMGKAFALAKQHWQEDAERIQDYRQRFLQAFEALGGIHLTGCQTNCVPGCLNICIDDLDNSALLAALHDIAISASSACSSGDAASSHVLLALGLTDVQAQRSLRISMGRLSTDEEINYAIKHIQQKITDLRKC